MTVLGIDPGYDRMGWGLIQKEKGITRYLDCGVILTEKSSTLAQRLFRLAHELDDVFSRYNPDQVVVETLFFAKNVTTALAVAHARGVVFYVSKKYGTEPIEIAPNQVKSAVTGNGHADKKTVEKMLRLQMPGIPTQVIDDTIDALAIALSFPTAKTTL